MLALFEKTTYNQVTPNFVKGKGNFPQEEFT